MDKKDLIECTAFRTGQNKKHAEEVLEAAFDEIYQSLKRGESVSLRNFGTFYIRPERSSTVFKFSPSQQWRKGLGWSSTYKGVGVDRAPRYTFLFFSSISCDYSGK